MIRLLFVALVLALFFIFSIPMYFVQYIAGKINPHSQFKIAQAVAAGTFKLILFISGVKVTVSGLENVPKNQAVLYVCNHRSNFDILIGYSTVPTLTSFVAKKEMEKIPCIRIWMRYMKCLFLDRDNIKEGLKTILLGIDQMKKGYSVFIMPEGTRNHGEHILPFHEGSFKLAEKSGCPIVPIAMTNTDDIFENHLPWIKSAHVKVQYGKPIYINQLEKEEKKRIGSYTRNIVEEMWKEIS